MLNKKIFYEQLLFSELNLATQSKGIENHLVIAVTIYVLSAYFWNIFKDATEIWGTVGRGSLDSAH